MSILADRLKELREEKELMQKEVASFLNISTSAYGFYEQDKRTPTPDVLSKLADYFNVSVDFLLGRTNVRKDGIVIIDEPEIHLGEKAKERLITVAAHLENFSEEEMDEVNNFIGYLKSRGKKS